MRKITNNLNCPPLTTLLLFLLYINSHSYITKPNTEIIVAGASIGKITCQDVQDYIDVVNPNECSFIQQITWNSRSDPCGCVDATTGERCGPPPVAEVQGCEICSGPDMTIGDPNRLIDDDSNWFDGVTCGEIAEVQLDFSSNTICSMAQRAAADFCKCLPVGQTLGNDACIPPADPTIPGGNSCDPNDASEQCCEGECRFRLTHGTHVCTTKAAQTPPNGYQFESEDEVPITGISFEAPSGGGCTSIGGATCNVDEDCCGNMYCLDGYKMCISPRSASMGMQSARGGGGAGGGRKLATKKKHNSHHHHHNNNNNKQRKTTETKTLRQMNN